ncbi:GyrI-like domain-containing protein [Cellulomonas endophytica]|uniref:GyrI-like domain-containing protein n=1 Tax=Cellulomonas endophytica TaxID=2494735 RepID=UPI001011EA9A|nr:GyrI-like domain-containing protein [Cellulomonas endophytica]
MRTDLRRTLDRYAARRGEPRVLEVPPARYLAVDGRGDPDTVPAYAEAVALLYPVAYALRAVSREALGADYVVPPLEGLWWADDPVSFTDRRDKGAWSWTLLVLVPDGLGDEHVAAARAAVAARSPVLPLDRLHVLGLDEGLCVQTLHVGPYDDEGPVLADLHGRFLPEHGLVPTGRHHEVYLGDPRRTAPERLRTILRQPVRRTADAAG